MAKVLSNKGIRLSFDTGNFNLTGEHIYVLYNDPQLKRIDLYKLESKFHINWS